MYPGIQGLLGLRNLCTEIYALKSMHWNLCTGICAQGRGSEAKPSQCIDSDTLSVRIYALFRFWASCVPGKVPDRPQLRPQEVRTQPRERKRERERERDRDREREREGEREREVKARCCCMERQRRALPA